MRDEFKIKWQVNDGYATGDRPQSTSIPKDDIRECDTVEEAMKIIDEYVEEDFGQEISWAYDRDEVEEKVKEILAAKTA